MYMWNGGVVIGPLTPELLQTCRVKGHKLLYAGFRSAGSANYRNALRQMDTSISPNRNNVPKRVQGGTESDISPSMRGFMYLYSQPFRSTQIAETEIRGGRGSKDGLVRQLPLYDTPYEPEENGGELDGGRCSRESRLPQDDERPPEEYDQPWEWKKERISKAFAALLCYNCISHEDSSSRGPTSRDADISRPLKVQFDGVEKSRMSPTKDLKSRPLQRHSSGCLVNTKMSSLDHTAPTVGERIDPSMPLESQFWYHGAISRTDAESLLRLCKEASYLVRNSETSKSDFSLSLKSSQGFMHMKLSRTKDNKYVLGQNSCLFDNVPEIIHFYSSRKLPIKGAEHMSLLYPVAIRTL
ncbi:putative SH2 domain-containing adapter protein F [Triplophysa rosa]|uniref:SH2 domain-containing adapter protein F n=1 Tax=Triplophysa rosa TaxID=992332 RepID=A0A9W7TU80_TRIRA|nr:putative SH2 domain-containing adapter protein F [Triplophysa rosa]